VSPECPATTVVGFRAKRPSVGFCHRRGSKEERQPSPASGLSAGGATHCTSGLEHTVITIGIDPHKGSHTATAVDASEAVVGELRVAADRHQRARLIEWAARFEPRRWAIEGATGLGALLAQQLVGAGEHVVDVPPKLSARVRLMDTGRIDKTDPNDARSAAIVALRNATMNSVSADSEHRVVLRLLADRYHQLTAQRTRSVCRLHAVLCLLIEGGTGRSLSTPRAVKLLAGVAIGDPIIAERVATCRQFVTELEALDQALVDIRARTVSAVDASKTTVIDVYGVGPIGAAIILGHSGDIRRFPTAGHYARHNGTAPIEASSGPKARHRLNPRGDRQINHAIHTAALTQIAHDHPGRAYYARKLAEGKTKKEALRALKRRISDVIYRQLLADT
jgi:transposase